MTGRKRTGRRALPAEGIAKPLREVEEFLAEELGVPWAKYRPLGSPWSRSLRAAAVCIPSPAGDVWLLVPMRDGDTVLHIVDVADWLRGLVDHPLSLTDI